MSDLCRCCGILREQMGDPPEPHRGVAIVEIRLVSSPGVGHLATFAIPAEPGTMYVQQYPLGGDMLISEIHVMVH